jgi:hypothetical protein
MTTQQSDDYYLGHGTPFTPPAGGSGDYLPTSLSGSISYVDPSLGMDIHVTISWNLSRLTE